MDMIWQEYQRRRVRRRAERMHFSWTAELPSQSSRHDVSVSQTEREAQRAGEANVWLYEDKPGNSHAIAPTLIIHISDHTASDAEDFDRPRVSLPAIGSGSCSKNCKCDTTSSSSFFAFHWRLNIWWVVASLHLLILNKSEGWISLRATFSISFTISPQIGEDINSLNFSSCGRQKKKKIEKLHTHRCGEEFILLCVWTGLLCLAAGMGALQGPFLLIRSHYHPTVTVSLSPHPSQSTEQPHSPAQTHN